MSWLSRYSEGYRLLLTEDKLKVEEVYEKNYRGLGKLVILSFFTRKKM